MNTIEQVTSAFTELDHLRSKDEANENMIRLLNEQNELLSMEMIKMASDHATELRKTKQRCDLAVRREAEIEGLLSTVAADLSSIAGRVLAVMRKRSCLLISRNPCCWRLLLMLELQRAPAA